MSRWNDISDTELTAAGPFQWNGVVIKQLYSRGSSSQLSALQFAFKIVLPNGQVNYDKGANGNSSYYQVMSPVLSPACDPFTKSGCALSLQVVP